MITSVGLLIALIICAMFICIPSALQLRWYGFKWWKCVIVSVAIIVTGLIGAELWYFLENGDWGGKSFFGAVYFAPLTFIAVAKILKMPYVYSLDLCATSGCLALAVLKVQCLIDGCCAGVILGQTEDNIYVRFPSQIVEFVTALILTVLLLYLSYNPKYRGKIYPITLVLYGTLRFVLNLFRDDWDRTQSFNLPLPLGNIWALIAVIVGAVWLIALKRKRKSNIEQ
ncbi:MAG: prolipoprotein diacylglyceryl transferase [Clostridia bacterium]|nr:prolipoprotein diacylglyceryl transferase [Clostridia bacterium]MBR6650032.1 prolipoprotein diacylglyceryl transferase [Clostridia bacterium]